MRGAGPATACAIQRLPSTSRRGQPLGKSHAERIFPEAKERIPKDGNREPVQHLDLGGSLGAVNARTQLIGLVPERTESKSNGTTLSQKVNLFNVRPVFNQHKRSQA